MSTKDEPGPFDGLERAKPGEPVFTLQGGDPLGAPLVKLWAHIARARGAGTELDMEIITDVWHAAAPEDREEKRAALLLRANEAEVIAWQMDEYRDGIAPIEEDVSTRPTYSGNMLEPAEVEAKRRFDAIAGAATNLDNAVALIALALESLTEHDPLCGLKPLQQHIDGLKYLAAAIRPKRASYAHRMPHEEVG